MTESYEYENIKINQFPLAIVPKRFNRHIIIVMFRKKRQKAMVERFAYIDHDNK